TGEPTSGPYDGTLRRAFHLKFSRCCWMSSMSLCRYMAETSRLRSATSQGAPLVPDQAAARDGCPDVCPSNGYPLRPMLWEKRPPGTRHRDCPSVSAPV